MHLIQKLGLVLGDSSLNLRPHEKFVIVVKDLEHLVGCDSLSELLLKQLCELRLYLRRALVISFVRRIPGLLPLLRGIKHVVNIFDKCGESITNVI